MKTILLLLCFIQFLVVFSFATPILLNPNQLWNGTACCLNSNGMTIFMIEISNKTTPFEIQLIRRTPILHENGANIFIDFNRIPDSKSVSSPYFFYVSSSSWPKLQPGTFYVGVYSNYSQFDYSIQYCYGSCPNYCPSSCSGHGGCDISSGRCNCDLDSQGWMGSSCSVSSVSAVSSILGMSILVFIIVLIIVFVLCVLLPVILILVCCCGICAAAGVAVSDPYHQHHHHHHPHQSGHNVQFVTEAQPLLLTPQQGTVQVHYRV